MSGTTLAKPAPNLPPEVVHEIINLATPVDWSANSVERYKALCSLSLVNKTWGAQAQALLFQEIHVQHQGDVSQLLRGLTDGSRRTRKLFVGDLKLRAESDSKPVRSEMLATILEKLPSVQEVVLGRDVEDVHLTDVCGAGVTTLRFLRYATFRSPQDHTFANITSLHLPRIDEETCLSFPALVALYTNENLMDWADQNLLMPKLEAFGFDAGESWPLTSPLKLLQTPVLNESFILPTSLEVLRVSSGQGMVFDVISLFYKNLIAYLLSMPAFRVLHLPLESCADDATIASYPKSATFSTRRSRAIQVASRIAMPGNPFRLNGDFEESCTAAGVSIVYSQDLQDEYKTSDAELLRTNFWDEVASLSS